jgi:hypothetical protein
VPAVRVRPVSGLLSSDRPWGLACLADSLWTTASPRELIRLDRDGHLRQRTVLKVPLVALFNAGDRLLFQQVTPAMGGPLLSTGSPDDSASLRPFAGLAYRQNVSREAELTLNILNCGLGDGAVVPCWFPDQPDVSLSDGVRAVQTSLRRWLAPNSSAVTPLWDVALAGGHMWVLVARPDGAGRRAGGGWLLYSAQSAEASDSLRLPEAARIIVSASDRSCLLLTEAGSLVEVERR